MSQIVIIRNIPGSKSDEWLTTYIHTFGKVDNIVFGRQLKQPNFKQCAVFFGDSIEAARVLTKFENNVMDDSKLSASFPQRSEYFLQIKNWPKALGSKEIIDLFNSYGAIVHLRIVEARKRTSNAEPKRTGIYVIEYDNPISATNAYIELNDKNFIADGVTYVFNLKLIDQCVIRKVKTYDIKILDNNVEVQKMIEYFDEYRKAFSCTVFFDDSGKRTHSSVMLKSIAEARRAYSKMKKLGMQLEVNFGAI